MTQPEIVATVKLGGKILIKVEGIKGTTCTEFSQNLLQRLGGEQEQTLTSEYYEKPTETRQEIRT